MRLIENANNHCTQNPIFEKLCLSPYEVQGTGFEHQFTDEKSTFSPVCFKIHNYIKDI